MDEYNLSGSAAALGRQFVDQVGSDRQSLAAVSPESLDPSPSVREFARESEPMVAEHATWLLDELDALAAASDVETAAVKAVPLALNADPGCSLVGISGERTESGSALLGRNHDFYPSFRQYSKLYRTDPADGLASVGCAHAFVGRLDGVNEAGLAIGFSGVPTEQYEPGVMWPLAGRAMLDSCETVPEAVEFLEAIPHAKNVNFLVADAAGDVAVVEASPVEVHARRPTDGVVVATNQFTSETMRVHQSIERTPGDCSRYGTIERWIEDREGPVTAEDVQQLLGDPEEGVCWRLDEAGDDPRSTIWSWVFETGAERGTLARDSPVETSYEAESIP